MINLLYNLHVHIIGPNRSDPGPDRANCGNKFALQFAWPRKRSKLVRSRSGSRMALDLPAKSPSFVLQSAWIWVFIRPGPDWTEKPKEGDFADCWLGRSGQSKSVLRSRLEILEQHLLEIWTGILQEKILFETWPAEDLSRNFYRSNRPGGGDWGR